MADSINQSNSSKPRKLRIIGTLILLIGVTAAGLLYRHGRQAENLGDDMSTLGFNRAQGRQMDMLYGKSGAMIQELSDNLKDPTVQAGIVLVVALITAGGCFYLAPFAGRSHAPSETGSPHKPVA